MSSSQSMSNVPSIRPRAIGELTFNAIGALFGESCPQLAHELFVESLSKCEHTCGHVMTDMIPAR